MTMVGGMHSSGVGDLMPVWKIMCVFFSPLWPLFSALSYDYVYGTLTKHILHPLQDPSHHHPSSYQQ